MKSSTMTKALLISSTVLSVALAIAIIILAINYASLNHVIQASQVSTCLKGNVTRAETGRIITEIVNLLSHSAKTAGRLMTLKHDVAVNYSKINKCG